jgi:hypothetical protein
LKTDSKKPCCTLLYSLRFLTAFLGVRCTLGLFVGGFAGLQGVSPLALALLTFLTVPTWNNLAFCLGVTSTMTELITTMQRGMTMTTQNNDVAVLKAQVFKLSDELYYLLKAYQGVQLMACTSSCES